MTEERRAVIGVIGGSQASPEDLERAEEVGRRLAGAGAILVCGGLGGVMEAAARGAKAEGGATVGILPGGSRADANRYIDIAIATNMGHARNAIIANTCDSLIAVAGGYGTLSEMAFGLDQGKPVIALGSWQVDAAVLRAESAEDAVAKALAGSVRPKE
jgi:uncharacterized protein (TIGR00725 family)